MDHDVLLGQLAARRHRSDRPLIGKNIPVDVKGYVRVPIVARALHLRAYVVAAEQRDRSGNPHSGGDRRRSLTDDRLRPQHAEPCSGKQHMKKLPQITLLLDAGHAGAGGADGSGGHRVAVVGGAWCRGRAGAGRRVADPG